MKKIDYNPVIFGTICEGRCEADAGLARMISRSIGDSVLLPFSVDRRYLKNVVLTMKLMDIAGLVVTGNHRKNILRHIPTLDSSAKAARMVDTIVRRRGDFVGYCAEEIALSEWRQGAGGKRAAPRRKKPSDLERRAKRTRVGLLTSGVNNN